MALFLTGGARPAAPTAGRPESGGPPRRPRAQRPVCRHCGSPILDHRLEETGFCCSGCAYVHRLINERGFEAYYRFKDAVTPPTYPAVFQPRDYGWLEEECQRAEAQARGAGVAGTELAVQGISCAACVWLIERVTSAEPGIREVVVDAVRGALRVRWATGQFGAGGWARRLQGFGYLLGPAGDTPERLESSALVRRIGLSAACAMNVMLFTLPAYFGMSPTFAYAGLFRLLALAFATLSVLAGGSYFFARAAAAPRARTAHIDLPIAIGIAGAYAGSLYGWLTGQPRFMYFDFVATFTVLMLVGRWAQVRAVERNRQRLLRRQPLAPRVRLADGGILPRERLTGGEVILVGTGMTLPVDAVIEQGEATFSLASISGEPEPRLFGPGSRVAGGAVNVGRGEARLRTVQSWSDSLLSQLLAPSPARSGADSPSVLQGGKPRPDLLERIVRGYVVGILAGSALAWVGWTLFAPGDARAATVALSVLVVSCPCAIGLALPLADEIAATAARGRGVFVREGSLWRRLGKVKRIVFDKTGTLTLETPTLANPEALDRLADPERAALRALVEDSLHPVSQCLHEALLARPEAERIPVSCPEPIEESPGSGVRRGGWTLGRAGWADDEGPGAETVFAQGRKVVARFTFIDSPRPNAAQELRSLEARGYEVYLLSGDDSRKVAALARELGLPEDRAIGGQSAIDKAAWIERRGGAGTLMLGDGANDSLAFDRAACRGTPVVHRGVLEAKADFYYLRRGVEGIRELLAIDAVRRRTQAATLVFSVAYNTLAAGFAVAGRISPLTAAVLMPLSSLASLFVVGVGMRGIMAGDAVDSPPVRTVRP
jgi:Cu2+-exporting ATPase